MMAGLKELLKKKAMAGQFMDDRERDLAKGVVEDLDKMAAEGLSHDLKKVTVASDSKEGLKEGLEKAEEIVEKGPTQFEEMKPEVNEDYDKEETAEEIGDKSPENMEEMDEEMSDDEIDQMIEMLQAKKKQKV